MILPPATVALLSRLPAPDAAAMAPALRPEARTQLRNLAIRTAISRQYAGMPRTVAAKALARDMKAPAEIAATTRGEIAAAILALSGGRPIGWRQICNISDGLVG
jgi:hypothetical protein